MIEGLAGLPLLSAIRRGRSKNARSGRRSDTYSSCLLTLVIVATLDEEEGVGPTLLEINKCLGKPLCLVVDGHSTDNTVRIARSVDAEVITQTGLGKGDAIATAIAYCERLNIKYVVFIDADFTYPAGYLPRMIGLLEENPRVGMVCGNRFVEPNLGIMRNTFYVGNRLLAFIHNLLNGVSLQDPLTGLRVARWEILKGWKPKSEGFDIEVELNHHVERKGYVIMEIPISYRVRLGEKKLKLRHGFTILRRILAESLAWTPSRPNLGFGMRPTDCE